MGREENGIVKRNGVSMDSLIQIMKDVRENDSRTTTVDPVG